jgi:hypothetical protein
MGGIDAAGVIGPPLDNECRSANPRDARPPRLASVGANAAARSISGDVKRLKRLFESDV